jgi:hypothetical protein
VVSRVDEAMPSGPDARDRVARLLADHYAHMGLPLRLSWTTPMARPQGAVAVGAAGTGQWLVVLSCPPQRLDELLGGFEAAVASLRADPFEVPQGPPDWVVLLGFAAAGLLAAAIARVARARRASPGREAPSSAGSPRAR